MLKANTKNVIFILIPLTLALLSGCTGPEEKRSHSLNEISQLRAAGDYANALTLLDALNQTHPNDPEVLKQIGELHEAQGNHTEAAFYLSAALALTPDDVELLYQTYRSQEKANQSEAAHALLEALVLAEPSAISDALWRRLGALRAQAQQTQPALDAYLKGVDPDNETPSAETAAAIGTLFKQLDNLPQAERWLTIAANSDDPNALTALLGLLEIHLRNKNWSAAETTIAQLDKQFPGALDASQWASARGELERWRSAQETMRAELAKAKAAEAAAAATKAAAEAAAEREAAAKPAEAATTVVTEANNDTPDAEATTGETKTETTSETAPETATTGKAQVIADMEHAEALANAPAIEAETADTTIAYDPNIAIEPAEPALTFDVAYDQQSQGATIDYSVSNSDLNDAIAPDAIIEPEALTAAATGISATQTPRSLDRLLADAESASMQHDYKAAIQIYWEALGRANNRADIWNQLSLAYRLDGQPKNAETTALEATRLAPDEIDYTLDYLRTIQRTKKPEDFLAELETAYDRFPRSPEIAISLARAYERINGNNSTAIVLYERFIDLAPNHPLRPEAESALRRLR